MASRARDHSSAVAQRTAAAVAVALDGAPGGAAFTRNYAISARQTGPAARESRATTACGFTEAETGLQPAVLKIQVARAYNRWAIFFED